MFCSFYLRALAQITVDNSICAYHVLLLFKCPLYDKHMSSSCSIWTDLTKSNVLIGCPKNKALVEKQMELVQVICRNRIHAHTQLTVRDNVTHKQKRQAEEEC